MNAPKIALAAITLSALSAGCAQHTPPPPVSPSMPPAVPESSPNPSANPLPPSPNTPNPNPPDSPPPTH